MLRNLPSLDRLLRQFQQVPYLASKNTYRVAAHFLHMSDAQLKEFCTLLIQAQRNLTKCPVCYCWREKEAECSFCTAKKRDQQVVCVVQTWQELLAIEKTGGYAGVYHVLGGAICPLEGVGPEDLTIASLLQRIETHGVKEIILALNQTPEGEATAAFIANKVKVFDGLLVSCLARGLPVGSLLDSMDRLTVYKALAERRPF